jgi:glyceraldehyde-3-phosphate dehydrogenase (NADP+)
MPTLPESLIDLFPRPEEVPQSAVLSEPVEQRELLVAGELRATDAPCEDVFSPLCLRDGDRVEPVWMGSFPLLGDAELNTVLASASLAWSDGRGAWPTMSPGERIAHMERFLAAFASRRAEISRLLMWEIAKTEGDSLKEFDRTVDYVRDTIHAYKELDRQSSRFTIEGGIAAQIRRAPLGVTLCLGPYNYPLNETFTTLIPALLMGNPVIFKPPKLGVLLHRPLLEAFAESFPPGVIGTVTGNGATVVGPLMASGRIDVLAFIGTSRVADVIKRMHPKPHRLRCVLGLDAKNAGVVLSHADLELAAKECALGALSFNGQRCTAMKLLFVQRQALAEFTDRFVAAVEGLRPGMPWTPGVSLTPLPEPGKIAYLTGLVEDAKSQGARVLNERGGESALTYFHPAVLSPVTPRMRVFTEEQFGPIVPIAAFDEIEEPVRRIVESNYGQQVALFGTDPEEMARLVDPLVNQVCRVNLNSQCQRGPDAFPFTGRKDSAEGTLSVSDALRVFSIRTLVAAKENDVNRELLTKILRERRSRFLSTDFLF